ncbi:MAG: NTP transferase domain-containing protein [Chitinophagales bacterium]|nr:NTP transferase domain-containing protein [Chitinophagales bacterium]
MLYQATIEVIIMDSHKKQHQKHAKLARPSYGQFHRQEWGIVGTPCGNIQQLADTIIERLSDTYKIGYVDADHASEENGKEEEGARKHGASMVYTDKIGYHRFDVEAQMTPFQYRMQFLEQDAVIVNGNHFHAARQIVVIDSKKEESLKRKLKRLDNVVLILLAGDEKVVYPWLKDVLSNFDDIPKMKLEDEAGISIMIEKQLSAAQAPLYGLVLAGGKSQRMGEDKGALEYHGIPQRKYVYQLLSNFCKETYTSCRPDQADDMINPLADTFIGLGPFGGILSAFQQHPNAAWLVLACDLPLMDEATLEKLVAYRNHSKVATAFNSPVTEFPEPLIAIWEPRSYPRLLEFLAQGYSCPRKVLINSDIELLDPEDANTLRNANTPAEKEAIKDYLQQQKNVQ